MTQAQPGGQAADEGSGQERRTTTPNDVYLSHIARSALFPPRIGSSGSFRTHSHPSLLSPALDALTKLRNDLIRRTPGKAVSSFYPKGIVLVRDLSLASGGGVGGRREQEWQWNGQPTLDEANAALDVIPNVMRVTCSQSECDALLNKCDAVLKDKKTEKAFVRPCSRSSTSNDTTEGTSSCREIVLCTDTLLSKKGRTAANAAVSTSGDDRNRSSTGSASGQANLSDSRYANVANNDAPTLYAVEETLAREVTRLHLGVHNTKDDKKDPSKLTPKKLTCDQHAAMEVQAALESTCYYRSISLEGHVEKRKGSGLISGYSLLPTNIQRSMMHKCLTNAALVETCRVHGDKEGKSCVHEEVTKAVNGLFGDNTAGGERPEGEGSQTNAR